MTMQRFDPFALRERRSGRFQRALRLPNSVDAEKAEPSHANGVLTITVPKAGGQEGAQTRDQDRLTDLSPKTLIGRPWEGSPFFYERAAGLVVIVVGVEVGVFGVAVGFRIQLVCRFCLGRPCIGRGRPAGSGARVYTGLRGSSLRSDCVLAARHAGRARRCFRPWRLWQVPALALSERAVEQLLSCGYAVPDVGSFSPALHHVDEESGDVAPVVGVVSDVL